jgi:hypothetical protein
MSWLTLPAFGRVARDAAQFIRGVATATATAVVDYGIYEIADHASRKLTGHGLMHWAEKGASALWDKIRGVEKEHGVPLETLVRKVMAESPIAEHIVRRYSEQQERDRREKTQNPAEPLTLRELFWVVAAIPRDETLQQWAKRIGDKLGIEASVVIKRRLAAMDQET